ncbi:hypothetical protein ABES02_29470 [Neobacillus pocheonensis]|uniref:hypothetical protein n=1 Tax=Neobacillus pocheonensis TaxID=363869 RepID=UPI003D26FFAB
MRLQILCSAINVGHHGLHFQVQMFVSLDTRQLPSAVICVGRQEQPIQTRIECGFLLAFGQVLIADERQELDPFVDVRQELVPVYKRYNLL